ncbi:hypothetical protein CDAR_366161 [Caerostris darwini]|uniref:Uncharacterized protein n=1 Tax=Caerostris darwini TaxID=1538125 RepID=A0AAV4MS11_9ARAC|nr:hypothetical protein CDAR_366161 [Caerostris darwini]
MFSKVFIFAVLLCIALTQASFVPNYPVSVPLVTKVVAPAAVVRDVRGSAANVYSAGLGYNYGYNVYDNRFNDYALGYRGILGYNGLYDGYGYRGVLGYNGLYDGYGYRGALGYNGLLGGYGGFYGLRK